MSGPIKDIREVKMGRYEVEKEERPHSLEKRPEETDEIYRARLPPQLRDIQDPQQRMSTITKIVMKDKIAKTTRETLMRGWMWNFGQNIPIILNSPDIRALPKLGGKLPVIIVGGGPSLMKHRHIELLKKYKKVFPGIIVCTDKSFIPFLKKRVIPDYVLAADGNPVIAKYFDHPLVDKYKNRVSALFNTTVHPSVVDRFKGTKYFYHIIFDDPKQSNFLWCEKCGHGNLYEYPSLTRIFHYMTNNSMLMSMGNCGTLAWNMGIFFGAKEICLIGFDYGYTPDTPLATRSYYNLHMKKHKIDMVMEYPEDQRKGVKTMEEASKRLEEFEFDEKQMIEWQTRAKSEYKLQTNPDFDIKYETDFMWDNYRNLFQPWFKTAMNTFNIQTVNCTGGGALHGEGVVSIPFRKWLRKWCGGKAPKKERIKGNKGSKRKRRVKKAKLR